MLETNIKFILDRNLLQDNSRDGIRLNWHSFAAVSGCNLLRNGDDGMDVHASTVNASDCTAQGKGDDGFTAFRGGSLTLFGSTTIAQNGDDGINMTHNAEGTLAGTFIVTENGVNGLAFSMNSTMLVSGATWMLTRNGQASAGGDGMQISDGATLVAIRSSSIEASDNASNGIGAARNATLSVFGGSLLAACNGNNGLLLRSFAVLNLNNASLTSMDNATADIDVAPDSICVGCP